MTTSEEISVYFPSMWSTTWITGLPRFPPFFLVGPFFFERALKSSSMGWKRFKQKASDHHFSVHIQCTQQCVVHVGPRIINMCGEVDVFFGFFWPAGIMLTFTGVTSTQRKFKHVIRLLIPSRKLWLIHPEFSTITAKSKSGHFWGFCKIPFAVMCLSWVSKLHLLIGACIPLFVTS